MERRRRLGRAVTSGRKRVSVDKSGEMLLLPHVHIKYSRVCVCVCCVVCVCVHQCGILVHF